MGSPTSAVALLTAVCLAACFGLAQGAATPEAFLCFFGFVNPTGYAYVSYIQPRFPDVKFTPVIIGLDNTSIPYEVRRDLLRTQLAEKKCTVVIDNGGNYNYTLYRALRAEPNMPLWIETSRVKYYAKTIDEDPDKYPALRLWQLVEDQSITAINTALALGWKDVVIASTNKTGDNVTLAQVTKQAIQGGLTVHKTFVRGEEGMETMDDFISKVGEDTPTRAVLIATSETSVVQALVDAPRGLVPIVPLNKKTDYRIRGSLGVLAPQEIELQAPHQWQDHWKNFTNHTELWNMWQVTQPSRYRSYYFTKTRRQYDSYIEPVIVAMTTINEFYNKSTAGPTVAPTTQQLLQASRGLEVQLFTQFIRLANHSGGTYAPPRSLEVVLTQPPKSGIYYQWKVIANVSNDGTAWRTEDELQWPGVGKMKGIVSPLFPGPIVPETKTNWALIGVLAALALLLIVAGIALAAYFISRWAKLRHCPKNEDEPFTAFFVSTHNEDEIRDLYGYKALDIFASVRAIVLGAASDHSCFIARRLDAHYLLVAKSPVDAVRCAEAVVTKVSKLTAMTPPVAKKLRKANTTTPTTRSAAYTVHSGSKHSGSKSERSARSRVMAAGIAMSQSRKTGITPRVAVGMAHATGRIEVEEGTYTYAGEPIDIAASIADFAIHNQILATQELVQALPADSSITTNFEEYCEREFGRGRCAENYELLEYVADGCPRADPELAQAAREGKNEGGGGVGALSAALQAQCGGLVTRSVAVAAISIPELGTRSTDAVALARVQDAFEIVNTATEDFKGTFATMHDGWCVVTVNGTGGVAQAPMRATSLAVAAVDALRDGGFAASAGVAAGPTIAGSLPSDAAAARHMTCGGNSERARMLALGAVVCDSAVLVTEMVKREADSAFDFVASDVMGVRAPAKDTHAIAIPTRRNTAPLGDLVDVEEVEEPVSAGESPPAHIGTIAHLDTNTKQEAKTAALTYRTMKVFSVVAASTAGDVEDEWMYQLAAAGTGPCVRTNAAFDLITEGSIAEAEEKLADASKAMALVDTVEMAAVDGEGQRALTAAVRQGEVLCKQLQQATKVGADLQVALTEYAVSRTGEFAIALL